MAIRVSVLYPAAESARFDHAYYAATHMPMAGKLLKPVRYEVDRGLGGGAPGAPAPYVAGCHFWYANLADFQAAFGAAAAALMADIPNYTDIKPVIQISEIVPQ